MLRSRWRLSFLLLAALGASCDSSSVDADFTGIGLRMTFDAALPIVELHVRGQLDDDRPAFADGVVFVSEDPATTPTRTEQLTIVLEADKSGERVRLQVEGLDEDGAILAAGEDELRLALGYFITSTVTLTADVLCGNGGLDEAEVCDDGNRLPDDGCSPTCEVEDGFICVSTPSLCTSSGQTALVDATAGDCPGTGTSATPFCRIAPALQAPWADVVAVRAGRYDETLVIDRDLTIHAAPGTILESLDTPALDVSADLVRIDGLEIRGISRIGGGVRVGGDGGRVDLARMIVGPSSTVGVSIHGSVLLTLQNSRITRNAGGGLLLDTDRGFIVHNVFVTENGDEAADFGGVRFARAPTNSSFANNTIADNRASNDAQGGLHCMEPAQILNTIVWGNGTVTASVTQACDVAYSDVGPLEPGVVLPTDSLSEDPKFAPGYRLAPNSPCRDRGDPDSVADERAPAVDIDGEPRPQGPNVDIGADEVG